MMWLTFAISIVFTSEIFIILHINSPSICYLAVVHPMFLVLVSTVCRCWHQVPPNVNHFLTRMMVAKIKLNFMISVILSSVECF